MNWNRTRLAALTPAFFLMTAQAADVKSPAAKPKAAKSAGASKPDDIRVPLGLLPIQ